MGERGERGEEGEGRGGRGQRIRGEETSEGSNTLIGGVAF